jgi:hypothetical protein
MHKLTPVEEAKSLFNEAKDWGVWRWLTEKKRARQTADAAWEALEEYEKQLKAPRTVLHQLKDTEKEAYQARMDAEAQFDEADRRMSAGMACEGAQMALDAWRLREKYIRKLESLIKNS